MKEQVVSTTAEHDDETITPEMFAVALGATPGQIKAFNKALSKATGCAVMTILGGPDPWENGKIAMYGSVFHAGEDKHGRTFGQAFPNFKETYLTPFTRFLREVYPADVRLARALKQDEDAPGKSSQDGVGSSSKPVPDDRDVVNGEQVDEEIVMESASKTNSTEGHKAADDIDVKGESRRASEGQQSIEPLPSPIDPPPSPRVPEDKDQIPPPSPSPELDRDINDARELVEIEGAGPADGDDASGRLPEDRDGNDRQPSEEMPSGDASSQIPPGDIINPTVEPPTDEPTGAKSRKRQCSQAKVTESLVSTRPKRAWAGPASKEILTLAERAGLAGDIRAPNVPKKHRARKT
ncbi:hypothetical protein EV421DRAFT_1934439 [Armillaria borealis]|uniref:Uncharacterized protein n=1 Tax=Armillaria borealis TaxID=47425 RepID=A0AA39ME62_9AGAR|nr:hypothetical protein EV421DRAFT_1934439 [Armillaria borealis]